MLQRSWKCVSSLLIILAFLAACPAWATTYTVTSTADSGLGSLRAAIASASSGDTISFSLTYPATITLATTLTISTGLNIEGPGAGNLAVSGNNSVQVFNISSGITVSISGLTIENGGLFGVSGVGGGIGNSGTLTVTSSTLSGNIGGNGGGISNYGTLTVTNSTVSGNYAYDGGSIFNGNIGTLTLTNSTLSGNFAEASSGGLYNVGGTATVTNSTLSGNSSFSSGGGIVNGGTATLSGGGTISGGTLTLTNSTLSGNSSTDGDGGGIVNGGTLTVTNSTLSGNSAYDGGSIFNGNIGTLTLTNSTLSGNSATTVGGGIVNGGTLTVSSSTLSGNSASTGGGIVNDGTLTVKNSIVANSPSGGNCSGTFTSQGYNLSDDSTCTASFNQTGDLNGTPAGLANILESNGGPTQTIALFSSSPAVNAIPVADCTDTNGNPLTTDQRGVTRPQGTGCDIGAYELIQGLQVEAWGDNEDGELGNGTFTTASPYGSDTPVQVLGPGGAGLLTGVAAVAGGESHSLALKDDGTVWAWGYNGYGNLGNGTITNSDTPVQVLGPGGSGFLTGVVAIAGEEGEGIPSSLALKHDGTVWAWGYNVYGELGNGTFTGLPPYGSNTPVQVLGPGGSGFLTGVVAIAGEGDGSSLALKDDGTVWDWGYNAAGELGNGTTTDSDTPVQVLGPGGSGFLTGVVAIAGGAEHSLALVNGQTITFTQPAPASANYNSTFPVAAESSSGLAVTLAVDDSSTSVCELGVPTVTGAVTSATVTMLSGTGACTIDANQPGNSTYGAAAQAQTSAAAAKINPTVTFTGAPASLGYEGTFTVASTTNSSTTAIYTSSGSCSNVGALYTMTSETGTCTSTATWAADDNYNGSTLSQITTATPGTLGGVQFTPSSSAQEVRGEGSTEYVGAVVFMADNAGTVAAGSSISLTYSAPVTEWTTSAVSCTGTCAGFLAYTTVSVSGSTLTIGFTGNVTFAANDFIATDQVRLNASAVATTGTTNITATPSSVSTAASPITFTYGGSLTVGVAVLPSTNSTSDVGRPQPVLTCGPGYIFSFNINEAIPDAWTTTAQEAAFTPNELVANGSWVSVTLNNVPAGFTIEATGGFSKTGNTAVNLVSVGTSPALAGTVPINGIGTATAAFSQTIAGTPIVFTYYFTAAALNNPDTLTLGIKHLTYDSKRRSLDNVRDTIPDNGQQTPRKHLLRSRLVDWCIWATAYFVNVGSDFLFFVSNSLLKYSIGRCF